MRAKNVSKQEQSTKSVAKYYYIMKEKPAPEFSGETVEEFLARGGKINKVEKTSKISPKRDDSGKFVKTAPIV